ncbi:MAG: DUF3052 domain-containing protein [Actinomycetes bacterium]
MAGYSGTPLPRKLGVRPEHRVLLVDLPDDVRLDLPDGATVHRRAGTAPYDLALAFCPDRARLERRFVPVAEHIGRDGTLWIAWPKRASGLATDLDENVVRDHGLAAGLVDVKVIAIDTTWSGLKFVYRLADR